MITEAFALATHRALSPAHPLMRLLKPNLLSTMAINALARQRYLLLRAYEGTFVNVVSRLLPQIQDLFSIGTLVQTSTCVSRGLRRNLTACQAIK